MKKKDDIEFAIDKDSFNVNKEKQRQIVLEIAKLVISKSDGSPESIDLLTFVLRDYLSSQDPSAKDPSEIEDLAIKLGVYVTKKIIFLSGIYNAIQKPE